MRGLRSHSLLTAALAATAMASTRLNVKTSGEINDSRHQDQKTIKGTAPNPARQTKAQKKAEKRTRRRALPDQANN